MWTEIRHVVCVLFAVTILAAPATGHAEEWIRFDTVKFSISGERPLDSFEDAIGDLIKLSREFKPNGARISDLRVVEKGPRGVPRVVFNASRGVGFVRYTARIKADIYTQKVSKGCARVPNSRAYRIWVNTTDSDNLVAANVSVFAVTLCVREAEGEKLDVVAIGRMRKGHDFGRFAGPAIANLIEAQTDSLLDALIKVVAFYQHQ